jgi:hypothetical protein
MKFTGTDHWGYKPDYDDEIEQLYRKHGWGALRIYNEIKKTYFVSDISIATVQRRLREIKKGE